MTRVHLGLGSNLGDRRASLGRALAHLGAEGLAVVRVSPVVESPALLPEAAPSSWNRPYLNLVAECRTEASAERVLERVRAIEERLGRAPGPRWSPRAIDIDILLWGAELIRTPELAIPHPELHRRGFVLAPLVALEPGLTIPGLGPKTVLEWSRELRHPIPLWMGIVNVTPDSFSDGGRYQEWSRVEPLLDDLDAAGAQIIDFGAQSTRPGAAPIGHEDEWHRLEPILGRALDRYRGSVMRPLLSVDTYHPEVATKALELGADVINDVGGLIAPEMIDLARAGGRDWIAMHRLTLPVDKKITLPIDRDAAAAVEDWLVARLDAWQTAGLDLDRIIFDPGIGFGKNALQSLQLLRQIARFRRHGLRILVGHSRKSFMKPWASDRDRDQDLATIGASLALCRQGVDILRVHNVPDHVAAYRAWSHLTG